MRHDWNHWLPGGMHVQRSASSATITNSDQLAQGQQRLTFRGYKAALPRRLCEGRRTLSKQRVSPIRTHSTWHCSMASTAAAEPATWSTAASAPPVRNDRVRKACAQRRRHSGARGRTIPARDDPRAMTRRTDYRCALARARVSSWPHVPTHSSQQLVFPSHRLPVDRCHDFLQNTANSSGKTKFLQEDYVCRLLSSPSPGSSITRLP